MTLTSSAGAAEALDALHSCPACGGRSLEAFLQAGELPVFCNVLANTREKALTASRAPLDLAVCRRCGMIRNLAYDPGLTTYAPGYDNSLHFSEVFERWAQSLARRLVETYDLSGGTLVEIGCGNGDFLRLLCAGAESRGFGFDPSCPTEEASDHVRIIRDVFGAEYLDGRSTGLVCARHVLEHLDDPGKLLRSIRRSAAVTEDTVVYVEVPDAEYMLRENEIWGLIYEHPSYFSATSLRALLERCDYDVLSVTTTFGDQFLSAEARPGRGAASRNADVGTSAAAAFAAEFVRRVEAWRSRVAAMPSGGAVVWGAGSKGITFLNLVDRERRLAGIVDINPRKVGRFVPGTAHRVLAPEELASSGIRHVVLMNPIYEDEVRRILSEVGSVAELSLA